MQNFSESYFTNGSGHPQAGDNQSNVDTEIPDGINIFHICLEAIMIFPTLFGNLLVIIAYFKFYVIRDEVSNIFILSLAITDFATGFLLPIHMAKRYIAPLADTVAFGHNAILCYVVQTFLIWPQGATISSLMVIAFNRMLAIASPLRYNAIMTKNVCRGLVVFAHCFPTIMAASCLVISVHVRGHVFPIGELCLFETAADQLVVKVVFAITVHVPMFATYTMHIFALVVALKQKRKIANESMAVDDSRKREYKILNTMSRILVVYTICYLPIAGEKMFGQVTPSSPWWQKTLNNVVFDLFYLNSALNPLIYAMSVVYFRKAFKKIVFGKCQQH